MHWKALIFSRDWILYDGYQTNLSGAKKRLGSQKTALDLLLFIKHFWVFNETKGEDRFMFHLNLVFSRTIAWIFQQLMQFSFFFSLGMSWSFQNYSWFDPCEKLDKEKRHKITSLIYVFSHLQVDIVFEPMIWKIIEKSNVAYIRRIQSNIIMVSTGTKICLNLIELTMDYKDWLHTNISRG